MSKQRCLDSKIKKRTLSGASSTSSFLSSQVVSNQVLSTYECLTTVFGMGTGGSTQLSPLDFFLRSTRVSVPSKLYRRQMEHFRVMAKLHVLSTFVCLAAVCSGQRQPIALRFQLALLGRFRTRGVRGFALRIRRPCESSPRHISTGRLHALRRFHSPPINLIVFEVPYRTAP